MTCLKQLSELKQTPAMLADKVGRRIMDGVITGRIQDVRGVDSEAIACGRGADLVRRTSHFNVARMLVNRDG